MDDADDNPVVENSVHNPEFAASRGVPALQLAPERLAHPVWTVR